MRILLDTHAVLWALGDPDRLGDQRDLVADAEVTRLLSAAVVWEAAIKVGLGRLTLGTSVAAWAARAEADLIAEALPVTAAHATGVAELPHHHRDPFDRLLIAQARALRVPIVTADAAFADYDVEILMISAGGRSPAG